MTAANPKAEPRSCESTVVVPENDKIDWFADGAFGKQRRSTNWRRPRRRPARSAGFCDPMLGVKAGPLFWFNNERASFTPAIGAALHVR